MVKTSLQEDILELLTKNKFGLSVSKIALQLNVSRTTVSKYLKMLETQGKVFVQDIGQYKLWHQKEQYLRNKSRREALSGFFEPFYGSLMNNLTQFIQNPVDLKDLGRVIAKDLIFAEITNTIVNQLQSNQIHQSNQDPHITPYFDELAQILMDIIDSLFMTFDTYHWQPPLLLENEHLIILRMENSDYLSCPAHFHILSGIIEEEMTKYIAVEVSIHQIHPQNQLIDIKFHFLGETL